MHKLTYANKFKKEYRKLITNNQELKKRIDKVYDLLKINPFYPSLKSHVVDYDPRYGNVWSSRVTGDIRILWAFDRYDNLVLILVKIGGHDFVY